jgi:hypothetical protein
MRSTWMMRDAMMRIGRGAKAVHLPALMSASGAQHVSGNFAA